MMRLTFEERLRISIDRSGRRHFAVAADAGISPARLSRALKRIELRPLKDEEIKRLARAVGVSVEELIEAEPERPQAA